MSRIVGIAEGDVVPTAALAARLLTQGHVIAVPTDTIYGVAALVQNKEAVDKLYEVKGRDYTKPISLSVATVRDIYQWAQVTVTENLLKSLLPGPVTLVFERSELLNKNFNPGTSRVGIRIPDHTFIRSVCELSRGPVALTSANQSGEQSTLSVEEFSYLHSQLHTVFDGGRLGETTQSRLGSTVTDLSVAGTYKVIRPGCALDFVHQVMREHQLSERI